MNELMDYIGYVKTVINGEVFVSIVFSSDPKIFNGEFYQITADYGEGSFGELYIMLKKRLETSERRTTAKNGKEI